MAPDDMTALNNMACLLARWFNPPSRRKAQVQPARLHLSRKQSARPVCSTRMVAAHARRAESMRHRGVAQGNELARFRRPLPSAMAYLQKQFPDEAQRN